MTPCPDPQDAPCYAYCPDGCPPGQSCYFIMEGFQDGYCTWTPPPSGSLYTSCESPEHDCCCKCEEIEGAPSCTFAIEFGVTPGDVNCFGSQQACISQNNDLFYNKESPCCTMTKPPSEELPHYLGICNITGCYCTPCNRLAQPRVPIDPARPYPYSDFYAPCYEPPIPFWEESDVTNKPLKAQYWSSVKFQEPGYNGCTELNKCRATCRVYSQCNENPEEIYDPCQEQNDTGYFCYSPEYPASECAQPTGFGTCEPLCTCQYGDPITTYQEFTCDGLGPIPYCEFFCPPDPCTAITCPPGYYCDPLANPNCQPLP